MTSDNITADGFMMIPPSKAGVQDVSQMQTLETADARFTNLFGNFFSINSNSKD